MSAEQKPVETPSQQMHNQHLKEQLQTNALGESLIGGWQKFKAGQLISYKWMGIILIAITAIGLTTYILLEKASERSKLWVELEAANSRTALEKFAEENPNTVAGNIAQLNLARYLVGPDGMDKLPTARDEAERKTAIKNIEDARDLFTKLIDAFKDQPALRVQCYMGMAKSEAAFIGLTKDGSLNETYGSVDKLIDWLDKVAEAAEGTPWGDDAKKRSESLKAGGTMKEEFLNVQRSLYNVALMPSFPDGGPLAPGKTPLDGGIPGLPGVGDPIAPTSPPSITPVPPIPKAPDPVPPPMTPDPKAPAPVPPPKAPEPVPPPKAPEPKAPEKAPDPVPPPKVPEPATPKK
jgi:hypothetical protein